MLRLIDKVRKLQPKPEGYWEGTKCQVKIKITGYLQEYLQQFLDYRKGMIFICDKGDFWGYSDELRNTLKIIGYLTISYNISNSKEIYEYLCEQLSQQLPLEIEQTVDAALGFKPYFFDAEFRKNFKAVFKQATSLQQLVDAYLMDAG